MAKLQLFVHGPGQNLSDMITTLKVDQMLCQNQSMVEDSGPEEAKTWRQIILYPLSWRIWTSFLGLFPFTFACLIRSYIFIRSEFEELCPIYIFSSSESEQIRLSKLN